MPHITHAKDAPYYMSNGRTRPFRPEFIEPNPENKYDYGHWKEEREYPLFKTMKNGPALLNMVIMSFERALECGGWRADSFINFMNEYMDVWPITLIQVIEDRLYHSVMNGGRGKPAHMTNGDYILWSTFCDKLRDILYE